MIKQNLEPYGVRHLKEVSTSEAPSIETWSWTPVKEADLSFLKINASFPGTTGTGPTFSDERQEESY
jgi:hypothetical protein